MCIPCDAHAVPFSWTAFRALLNATCIPAGFKVGSTHSRLSLASLESLPIVAGRALRKYPLWRKQALPMSAAEPCGERHWHDNSKLQPRLSGTHERWSSVRLVSLSMAGGRVSNSPCSVQGRVPTLPSVVVLGIINNDQRW